MTPYHPKHIKAKQLKDVQGTIVLTNGCFDIMHKGHIRCLELAKKLGDVLVIATNSDHAIQGLKGPTRPALPESSRVYTLCSFPFVDHVIVEDQCRLDSLFNAIPRIDVYVKGGDYSMDTLDKQERAALENHNPAFVFINIPDQPHTTDIINKLKGEKHD